MSGIEIILVTFLVWQISAMPIPVWIASAFFSVDSETYNESNEFAENIFSNFNTQWGGLVFFLELLKGFVAISLLSIIGESDVVILGIVPLKFFLASIIILAHTFPLFNEFRRSRSIGAYFGVFLGLLTLPGLLVLLVFSGLWLVNKKVTISSLYVSLSSLLMFTFIFSDVKALVIAFVLSFFLVISNFHPVYKLVRA